MDQAGALRERRPRRGRNTYERVRAAGREANQRRPAFSAVSWHTVQRSEALWVQTPTLAAVRCMPVLVTLDEGFVGIRKACAE